MGGLFFSASGLQDDVSIANLQDACLKLEVLDRARARELQVDRQVERAQQPLSAKTATPTTKRNPKMDAGMEAIASMHIHARMANSPTTVF